MALVKLRRCPGPPPPDDEYATVFIDQHGDALSVWVGTFHIQLYREWRWPYLGFEDFDSDE
jgi:hypothetical protein